MSVHQLFPATRSALGLPPILFPIESIDQFDLDRLTTRIIADVVRDRAAHSAMQLAWAARMDDWIAREGAA